MHSNTWRAIVVIAAAGHLTGCAEELHVGGFDPSDTDGAGASGAAGTGGAVGVSVGGGGIGVGGSFAGVGGTGGGAAAGEVFAHGQTTLVRLEPVSKSVTLVGEFDCVSVSSPGDTAGGMTDIALDKDGNMFGVGTAMTPTSCCQATLFTIDKTTAHCEVVASLDVEDPRGLSFVPAGIVDAVKETLVLQRGADFFRMDPATGDTVALSTVTSPTTKWSTKGSDVVSIDGDATYTIAYDETDTQHLLAIDIDSGSVVQDIAALPLTMNDFVMGAGYWGGRIYAFTFSGKLLEIDKDTGASTQISVSSVPSYGFRGAGVTTAAPIEWPK